MCTVCAKLQCAIKGTYTLNVCQEKLKSAIVKLSMYKLLFAVITVTNTSCSPFHKYECMCDFAIGFITFLTTKTCM